MEFTTSMIHFIFPIAFSSCVFLSVAISLQRETDKGLEREIYIPIEASSADIIEVREGEA